MKSDLDFLNDSQYKKVFKLIKNDPLMVVPSKPSVESFSKGKTMKGNYFIEND